MNEFTRRAILDRVRLATHFPSKGQTTDSYLNLPRTYLSSGQLCPEDRVALMIERLREYGADVVESTVKDHPAAIATQLEAGGRHSFVAPPGIPPAWRDKKFDWKIDRHLTHDEIEQAEGVLTASYCGVARRP